MIRRRRLQLLALVAVQFPSCSGFLCHQRIRHEAPYCDSLFPVFLKQSDQGDGSQSYSALRKFRTVNDVLEMMEEVGGPNSSAAALRCLADLSTSRHVSLENRALAQDRIPVLLEEVEQAVNDVSVSLNPHALADILAALAKLDSDIMPLAHRVCNLMDQYEDDVVKTLRPHRLVECLQSLVALELYHSCLIGRMCHRLQQGDALAMLDARHLAGGIKAIVMLEHVDVTVTTTTTTTMRAFMRRWRKQAVRKTASTADICQALYAARRVMQQNTANIDESLKNEITTMVHTLFRELHSPSPNATASRSLTAGQVAETIMTASTFQVNATNPIFDHLMGTLGQERTVERAKVPDIARILLSMEKLRLSGYPFSVRRLGLQFLVLVQQESVEARSVANILWSALRLHQRDDEVMGAFTNATRYLLVQIPKDDDSSFLQSCSHDELRSLVRFLSLVRCDDEEALVALTKRILEPDIVESCSPRAASQILTYFTALIDVSTEEMLEMRSLLSELFHGLGIHLLSTQLTPAETSAAMQAYAKASYIQDMGIFDHLASHLQTMLDDCTVRHVVQALWSMGKMVVWESDHGEEEELGPPYLEAAREYAAFLVLRVTELTVKDVAQALWALGRLKIDDVKVGCAFAYRAGRVASECTSHEIANILWGLSRVGYDNREVVSVLTKHLLEVRPSSQEAATVLYALGRMEIRDEEVFSALSKTMMEQLETASAQAIANALWAYRTVQIPPPRELMDSWVIQKLGLDGVRVNQVEDL